MTVEVRTFEAAVTYGQWVTEIESASAFDAVIETTDCFRIFREIRGAYIQPRFDQPLATPRIDRILSPTSKLIEAGWTHGPIGIECKPSNTKVGPPLAQMLDYSRAVWQLPNGFRVLLSWVFLWPLEKQGSTVGSVMAQNRLGSAEGTSWDLLRLRSGEQYILRVDRNGEIGLGEAANGRKIGSR